MKPLPLMNLEFIKLYKAMRAAQREHLKLTAPLGGPRARIATRQAARLEQLCDVKIEAYEREINEALKELEAEHG